MTRIYFDTEFIEDGSTIDLISIGMVNDAGDELHLCNRECQLHRASDWVIDNVFPRLPNLGEERWVTRSVMRDAIVRFVERTAGTSQYWKNGLQFWAYYADYDWVALCQLFGRMIDLPDGFPMFCMDLKQLSVMKGNPQHPPDPENEHDALADAKWNRELYRYLEAL